MGILHEILIAIGVVLMVAISNSVVSLGQEYARSGHISLAIVDAIHSAKASHCVPPRHKGVAAHN
jgi:hypothetical protein